MKNILYLLFTVGFSLLVTHGIEKVFHINVTGWNVLIDLVIYLIVVAIITILLCVFDSNFRSYLLHK